MHLSKEGNKPLVSYSKPASSIVEYFISILLLIGHAWWLDSVLFPPLGDFG